MPKCQGFPAGRGYPTRYQRPAQTWQTQLPVVEYSSFWHGRRILLSTPLSMDRSGKIVLYVGWISLSIPSGSGRLRQTEQSRLIHHRGHPRCFLRVLGTCIPILPLEKAVWPAVWTLDSPFPTVALALPTRHAETESYPTSRHATCSLQTPASNP